MTNETFIHSARACRLLSNVPTANGFVRIFSGPLCRAIYLFIYFLSVESKRFGDMVEVVAYLLTWALTRRVGSQSSRTTTQPGCPPRQKNASFQGVGIGFFAPGISENPVGLWPLRTGFQGNTTLSLADITLTLGRSHVKRLVKAEIPVTLKGL